MSLMIISRLALIQGWEQLLYLFQQFSIVCCLIRFFYQIYDCLDLASILEIALVSWIIFADQIQLSTLS